MTTTSSTLPPQLRRAVRGAARRLVPIARTATRRLERVGRVRARGDSPVTSAGEAPDATTAPRWVNDRELVVDGVTFVASTTDRFASTPERFCLVKPRDLVQQHLDLLERERPKRIVELGICKGGSTALMALVARPEMLVAFELDAWEQQGLAALRRRRGLTDTVRTHYGTDQSDVATITRLVDEAFGDQPLDLVVDDASHLVGPSRASFDALFPRLRPGGLYVIEDWAWAHVGFGAQWPDQVPLTALVFETILALPSTPGLIDEIHVDHHWAVLRRGPAPLDPATFDLRTCFGPRGHALLAPPPADA